MDSGNIWMNVAIVAQQGRIGYQALLCVASIRAHHSAKQVRIFVCIPNNSELWETDPRVEDADVMQAFKRYECEIVFFDNVHFGSRYPHSNKFYSILSLPPEERFLFLDSDTILTRRAEPSDFDFAKPGLKPAGTTWPDAGQGRYTIAEIWRSLYDFFELDPAGYFEAERGADSHQCYPYYQGNVMYYEDAELFGRIMLDFARRLWREQPSALEGQPMTPWLDQIVLPLLLAKVGVPRRNETDPIQDAIVHYQYPMFLLLPNGKEKKHFARLSTDSQLISILRHDRGFDYYLSEEGRELYRRTHAEFAGSAGKGEKGNRKELKRIIRRRAPVMR